MGSQCTGASSACLTDTVHVLGESSCIKTEAPIGWKSKEKVPFQFFEMPGRDALSCQDHDENPSESDADDLASGRSVGNGPHLCCDVSKVQPRLVDIKPPPEMLSKTQAPPQESQSSSQAECEERVVTLGENARLQLEHPDFAQFSSKVIPTSKSKRRVSSGTPQRPKYFDALGQEVLEELTDKHHIVMISYVLLLHVGKKHWESVIFSEHDNLDQVASVFLKKHSISGHCKAGLVTRMQEMVVSGLVRSYVDIVDLV